MMSPYHLRAYFLPFLFQWLRKDGSQITTNSNLEGEIWPDLTWFCPNNMCLIRSSIITGGLHPCKVMLMSCGNTSAALFSPGED